MNNTYLTKAVRFATMLCLALAVGGGILSAQTVKVSGRVTDSHDLALAGAVVHVAGTNNAVAADQDGNYTISVKPTDRLTVSYVGYTTQEVEVGTQTTVNFKLEEDKTIIEDVVVVGFGTQKKANLTGAVSQVKMSDVAGDRPVINTTSALQGAIPGLQITRSSTPGQNSNSINIRGTLSINGSSPLILIDNVPGSLAMLNPDDIESITVLKDAAAAAIYGARAAEGVILISTKRPASGATFQLNYNNNFGFESTIQQPKQASLDEYFRAYLESGMGGGTYWSNSQDVAKWREYAAEYKKNPSSFETIGDGIYIADDGHPYYLHEQDLYKNMLETGFLQSHNISASGGTDRIRFRVSGGYNHEDGPLITGKDNYKRLNVGAFVSADMTKWFTQELDVRYAKSTKQMPSSNTGAIYSLRLISYYPEGNMPASLCLSGEETPIFTPKNSVLSAPTTNLTTSNPRIFTKSIIKPLKDWQIVFEYTYDQNANNYNYYSGQQTYTTIQLAATTSPSSDYYTKQNYFTDYNAINLYTNYSHSFGDHNINVMLGYNQESSYYEYMGVTVYDQAVQSIPSFGGATGKVVPSDSYSEYAIRSGFYRINYNYKNRYLLETNARYDGSSKFPKSSRFGFFPSVSAGWQIANENFMSGTRGWLNELKLRGSWGQIGNQAINPYQYSPSMDISNTSSVWLENNGYVLTLGVPGLVSDSFTWETVTTTNIGLDFTLLKNRLRGSIEYYIRDTKDMLTDGLVQLPAVVGTTAPTQNSANMQTKGWELTLGWNDQIGKFGYRINVNLYDRKSKITKFDNNESGMISNYYVGRYIGEIWGYKADGYYSVDDFSDLTNWTLKEGVQSVLGVNVKPGDVKFKNLMDDESSTNRIDSGDGTLENPGDRAIIGNTTPRYQFGANFGVNYAGFDLSVMLQGVGKRDYWLSGQSIFPFAGSSSSDGQFQPVYYNQTDYWTAKSYDPTSADYMVATNPNAKLHRIYNQLENAGYNTRTSDKYLQNAAYLRIKNVTLSYTVPTRLIKKIDMSQLRVFASVENLATFTSLPQGFDPETLSWSYPFYRTISMGINVTF